MPFINYVEPEEAPDEVKRIFEAGEKQRGLLMTTWKLVAHSPKTYRAYGQFLGAVSNPEALSKRTLELAILKTSLLNSCIYCTTHHYHSALAAGVTLEEMLALNDYESFARFSEAEKTAVAFMELPPQALQDMMGPSKR